MTKEFNLDREFIKWFYEAEYPDLGSNRSMVMDSPQSIPTAISWKDYWMREAFKQGARAMANETRCVFMEYACATSGLEPELICPDEIFDRAEYNIKYFYKQVFGEDYEL